MEKNNIPEEVWESALVGGNGSESSHHRMYVMWNHLSKIKYADESLQLGRLSKVVLLVLVIHHSNVQEERVCSLITKNKTDLWPNLKLDGTLSSILQVKLVDPEPWY